MKKIVFDIETKTALYDPETPTLDDMEISVLSLWDSETNKYYSFTEEEFDKMWDFFKKADLMITFNGKYFDVPVLDKYAKKAGVDLFKIQHLDIFEKILQATGKKLGLDGIASNTLAISKSANGLQAVAWWNSGEIEKIKKYCEQDVKVTKDVYEYILKNGKFKYQDRKTKQIVEEKIDSSDWEKKEEKEMSLFEIQKQNEKKGDGPEQMSLF